MPTAWMLTGCQADAGTFDGSSGGSGGLQTPENICNGYGSQAYMQCTDSHQPPPNLNTNTFGSAG